MVCHVHREDASKLKPDKPENLVLEPAVDCFTSTKMAVRMPVEVFLSFFLTTQMELSI